jgi:hypothetical protein
MLNALIAVFLILVAASAAVTGSMIVLALFDLVFGKNRTPPVVTETSESEELEPLPEPDDDNRITRSKLKVEPLAPHRGYQLKGGAAPSPGYGPDSQRLRPPR